MMDNKPNRQMAAVNVSFATDSPLRCSFVSMKMSPCAACFLCRNKYTMFFLACRVFWHILHILIQCNAVVLSVAFVKQLKIEKTETYKHINNSVLCYGKQLDLMSINFCNRSNRCVKSSFVKWKEAFQFFQSSI